MGTSPLYLLAHFSLILSKKDVLEISRHRSQNALILKAQQNFPPVAAISTSSKNYQRYYVNTENNFAREIVTYIMRVHL